MAEWVGIAEFFCGYPEDPEKAEDPFGLSHVGDPFRAMDGESDLVKDVHVEHTKRFVLSTRSVATLFHPPTFIALTAPHLRRVESKKTGPPAGLAIYGDEADLGKYK